MDLFHSTVSRNPERYLTIRNSFKKIVKVLSSDIQTQDKIEIPQIYQFCCQFSVSKHKVQQIVITAFTFQSFIYCYSLVKEARTVQYS